MTTQELQIAKLRYLLYEAIVELEYVQVSEDHSLCATAKGREIVERGMKLLEVKDLSQEHLVGAQEENTRGGGERGSTVSDKDWKKEALALVVLLRAKCSDEEWANLESRFAVECTAPAPQPANGFSDSDWKWWFDLTAEGRMNMIRRFRATPHVTPTECEFLRQQVERLEKRIAAHDYPEENARMGCNNLVTPQVTPTPGNLLEKVVRLTDEVTHKEQVNSPLWLLGCEIYDDICAHYEVDELRKSEAHTRGKASG